MKAADRNAVYNTAPRLVGNVSTSSSSLSAPPLQHNIPVIMKQDAVWSLNYYDRAARCRLRRSEVMLTVRELLAVAADKPAKCVSRIPQEAFNKSTAERSETELSFNRPNLTAV